MNAARRGGMVGWKRRNLREYLYAGESKGAYLAAWRQAARAEAATALQLEYLQLSSIC